MERKKEKKKIKDFPFGWTLEMSKFRWHNQREGEKERDKARVWEKERERETGGEEKLM